MNIEVERWKAIEDWTEYRVSDRGRVKSSKYGKTRILKPRLSDRGYLLVGLCRDGEQKKAYVHRLVALAFCGGYEVGLEVDHKNGNKLDNRAENLRWVSSSLNHVHQQKAKSKSGFIGVYRKPGNRAKPFQAQAKDDTGKIKHLGCFSTAEEASASRDAFVRKRFSGEELTFHHKLGNAV